MHAQKGGASDDHDDGPRAPTDPLVHRFYELISAHGTTLNALIHEEFGDGTMENT